MQVKTKTKTLQLTPCKTPFQQLRGLIFKKIKNDGLLFIFDKERKIDLHMFFVFYTIDIVYLNKNKKVTEIKRNIKPFTPRIKSPKAKYILELKSAKGIQKNETIKF